jgi:hypothetical protein
MDDAGAPRSSILRAELSEGQFKLVFDLIHNLSGHAYATAVSDRFELRRNIDAIAKYVIPVLE